MDNYHSILGAWMIPFPPSIFRRLEARIQPIRLREETWMVSPIMSCVPARKKGILTPFGTAFLQVVHDLEEYARASSNSAILDSVQETRSTLEKLVQKMDNLEAGFDRIAERSRRLLVLSLLIVFSCGYLQCFLHLAYQRLEGSVCSILFYCHHCFRFLRSRHLSYRSRRDGFSRALGTTS